MSGPRARLSFDRAAWASLARIYRGELATLALLTLGAAMQSVLLLPTLLLVRLAFDRAVPQGDMALLLEIGLGLVLLRAGGSLVALAVRGRIVQVIRGATLRLRRELLAELYAQGHAADETRDTARLHAQIVFETERVDNMADAVLSGSLPAVVGCVVLLATLLYLKATLVAAILVFLPVLWLGGRLTGRRMQADIHEFQSAFEEFSRSVRFVLDHLPLTRARAAESWELARQDRVLARLRDAAMRMAEASARHSHLQTNLIGLPSVLILVAGGIAVAHGSMSFGGFLAFYVAAGLLNGQVDRLSGALPAVISGNRSLVTLQALREAGGPPAYAGRDQIDWQGGITLDRVGFGYGASPVLRAVSLRIRPGERIAVIGANGAGKTTLLHLILGFLRPQSGSLAADGVGYDTLDLSVLRRGIGLVPQHPTLFAGTMFDNIAYGRPEATREDALLAIGLAGADRLLARLPQGLDTQLGEGGALLSGGEKQLVALARAQLGQPRLLILDEPTNHLDQAAIAGLMHAVMHGRSHPAILLISHDPAVVAHADTVWRLQDSQLERLGGGELPEIHAPQPAIGEVR